MPMRMTLEEMNVVTGCDDITEAYLITDIVHVVCKGGEAKFEIYQNPLGNQKFDVFAYRKVDGVWVCWGDFPSSYSDSSQGALRRAVGWLRERAGAL